MSSLAFSPAGKHQTPADHYKIAEILISNAMEPPQPDGTFQGDERVDAWPEHRDLLLRMAQVHATLATVPPASSAWYPGSF